MLNSNKPIEVIHLQKLANQSMLNGALLLEMVNNSFSGRSNKFGLLIKQETFYLKKIEMWAVKNIFPIEITKYLT